MRRHLALGLLPALLVAGAGPAAAAPPGTAAPEPGTVLIHRTSPVVQYRLTSFDPVTGEQDDGGTVRIDYTCYPSLTDTQPDTVEMFVSIGSPGLGSVASAGPLGAQVPCDGQRHRIEVAVSRQGGGPFNPDVKRVSGSVGILVIDCLFCQESVETTYDAPATLVFQGFRDLPF